MDRRTRGARSSLLRRWERNAPRLRHPVQSSPFTSIQGAVDQATGFNEEVILVRPGTYNESINTFQKNLAIRTGKLNGQGCVPSIGSNGQASATSAAPFNITATDIVESKPGLMFYGLGQWAVPFQAGTHCVMLPTRRTPVRFSGSTGQPCSGTYNIEFNARIQSGIDPNLVPGALIYCQWWYRDGQAPGGFGSGLTDALCFGIAP